MNDFDEVMPSAEKKICLCILSRVGRLYELTKVIGILCSSFQLVVNIIILSGILGWLSVRME